MTTPIKRHELRTRFAEDGTEHFCRLEVKVTEDRLSICGSAGYVLDRQHFEALDELERDSLELLTIDRSDDHYVLTSCGQIREELASFFPEAVPFFRWHLNDLNAGCVHQDARGESYDTHPDAECLECGWKLGHGWSKRELPAAVVAWAATGDGVAPGKPTRPPGPQFVVRGRRTPLGAIGNASESFELNGAASDDVAASTHARTMLSERYEHIRIQHTLRVEEPSA